MELFHFWLLRFFLYAKIFIGSVLVFFGMFVPFMVFPFILLINQENWFGCIMLTIAWSLAGIKFYIHR